MTINHKIIIIVGLLTAVLFSMIWDKEWTLATGEEITLKLEPRDPRSLFRGDFMRLTYEINTLDAEIMNEADELSKNQVVYVAGKIVDGYWTAAKVSASKLTSELPVLKGRISSVHFESVNCDEENLNCDLKLDTIRVRYGIDTFFIPEGTGLALEDRVAKAGLDQVKVLVRVSGGGEGTLKSMLINGEPVYENRLF